MAKKSKNKINSNLLIACVLCGAAFILLVSIFLLASVSEPSDTSSIAGNPSDAPTLQTSSDPTQEESDNASEPSQDTSSSGDIFIDISLPPEISEPEEDPLPGVAGPFEQLDATHRYEKQIGLCYSVDLTEYEQYLDPADASQYLLLVNADHPLEENYKPDDLIYIVDMRAGRPDYYSYLREVPEKALEAFLDEAAAYGHGDIKVSNGYRSYSTQANLFYGYVNRELSRHPGWTYEQAYRYVGFYDKNIPGSGYSAVPGTSEHQSGLCVDMHNQIDTDHSFDNTPAARWLAENCYRFGFVLRFPAEKEDATGIQFESWHFRYVGRTAATEMHKLGMCLEEYLEYKGLI